MSRAPTPTQLRRSDFRERAEIRDGVGRGHARWVGVCLAAVVGAATPAAKGQPQPTQNDPLPTSGAEDGAEGAPGEVVEDVQLPPLSEEAAVARGVSYYDASRYDDCIRAFIPLVEPSSDRLLADARRLETARIYYAACLTATGKGEAADEQFRRAIRDNPQIGVPNSVVFPQAVVDRFIVVRSALLDEIRKAERERAERARQAALEARRKAEEERRRVARLEQLASQEVVVVRNSRWIASIPFGVGQFQNRDYALGGVFLATEVAFTASAITAVAIQLSLHSQAEGGTGLSASESDELNRNLDAAHAVELISLGGLILSAGLGIMEAHLSFVPEFRQGTRPRTKREKSETKEPAAAFFPSVDAKPSGGTVGVVGRF